MQYNWCHKKGRDTDGWWQRSDLCFCKLKNACDYQNLEKTRTQTEFLRSSYICFGDPADRPSDWGHACGDKEYCRLRASFISSYH
jgi:hypothetical protein